MYLHKREAENVFTVLGDVGGIHDIIRIFFFLIIGQYASKKFDVNLAKGTKVEVDPVRHRQSSSGNSLNGMRKKLKAGRDVQMNKFELKDLLS